MDNRDKGRIALRSFPLTGLPIAFLPAERGLPSSFGEFWTRDRLMWEAVVEFA